MPPWVKVDIPLFFSQDLESAAYHKKYFLYTNCANVLYWIKSNDEAFSNKQPPLDDQGIPKISPQGRHSK
jgi:hypothetical protein